MKLTSEEKDILAGDQGVAAKKAIEILVAIGKIFEASHMIPVASAQVAGVSYLNIGDPGLDFLTDWAQMGAKVRIPSFMNPAAIDRKLWRQMGIDTSFAHKQLDIINQLEKMGIEPTLTCTPYHIGYVPTMGQHIAWSESSAVSFANSVLGARTNREGGPSALAAAIVGRTPAFGLHLEQNRLASHHVVVKCKLNSPAEFGALGYLIGTSISSGVPLIDGLELPDNEWLKTVCLKAFGAAMAASGAVALYHINDVTPEAIENREELLINKPQTVKIESIKPAMKALHHAGDKLQLVTLGCPHASLDELRYISSLLCDKRLKTKLWITTSHAIKEIAEQEGILQMIERAGGMVIADTCMVVAPLKEMGFKYIAVDSAKAACYLPSHQGAMIFWGTTEQCIQAAIEGTWIL